jgi:hypothetical protein
MDKRKKITIGPVGMPDRRRTKDVPDQYMLPFCGQSGQKRKAKNDNVPKLQD